MNRGSDNRFTFQLAQQASINLIGKIIGRIFSFLFIVIISHIVSPATYGIFTLALAVVGISGSIFDFSLHQSIDYFIPRELNENRQHKARSIIIFISQIVLFSSMLGIGVISLLSGRIAIFFDMPILQQYLAIMVFLLPFQSFLNMEEVIFSSVKRIEYRVIVSEIGVPALKLVLIAPLVYIGYTIVGLAAGYLVAILTTFVIGLYPLFYHTPELKLSPCSFLSHSFSEYTELFNYVFPLYLTGIMYAVSNQASYFILGFYLNPSKVGTYRIAYQLTINLLLASLAIAPVIKPMMSGIETQKGIQERYQLATRWIALLTIPMASILLIAPGVYVRILFTADYVAAASAIVPLAAGYLLNAIFGPESMVIEATGNTRFTLINSLIKIGINTTLLFVLVPQFGVLGAGLATGITLSVVPFIAVVEVYLLESVHPFNMDTLKFLCSGGIASLLGHQITQLSSNNYIIAISLPVVLVITYLVLVSLMNGFSDKDEYVAKALDEFIGYRIFQRLM